MKYLACVGFSLFMFTSFWSIDNYAGTGKGIDKGKCKGGWRQKRAEKREKEEERCTKMYYISSATV